MGALPFGLGAPSVYRLSHVKNTRRHPHDHLFVKCRKHENSETMKIHIQPNFRGEDQGDGGIRRIVEAQQKWLPRLGHEIVDQIELAELISTHAGAVPNVPTDLPWVVHTHGLYWKEYPWPPWAIQMNGEVADAMRKADHVTAPSEWVAQALRRGMWLKPSVLHHGVDMDDWEPATTHGGYVLWNKNRPDPVCDPWPMLNLAKMTPDLKYVTTYGLASVEASANVSILNRIPYRQMRQIVREAGVYLSTTRETFGIGTIEAMAAGVPVVAWDWGGQREIIEHGVTGWLSPVNDYRALEEGVRWALQYRDTLKANVRQAVRERFTWEHRMADYADLYERVVEAKGMALAGPTVSVVMPCYKLSQYLPQAIASLQAQTMEDWECIIVNDASPDQTAEVAARLAAADSRVRVVTNASNLYLAGALNAGIAQAKGQYIVPLDADNMLDEWTLEILLKALDNDRGLHIAYGACRFVLEDGVTPDTGVSPDGVSGWPKDFSFGHQMLHRNQIPSTCMYRREVWKRTGGYRRRCRTAEDAEFWTRATSLGFKAAKVTSRTTLVYRQRAESMSRVVADWDWTAWFPWSIKHNLVPFGVAEPPPTSINNGMSWPVDSYEPIKVAVVIPVGPGHEEYLIDALDSVEAQTFRHFEVIVANDTGHPLDLPHTWVKVVEGGIDYKEVSAYHPFIPGDDPVLCNTCGEADNWHVRMGPAKARNLAISHTTAPLFVPLDADDYLQAEALEDFLKIHAQFGGYVYSQWWDDLGTKSVVYDPAEYDASLLIAKGALHAVTGLYTKEAWERVGGFDEKLSHWEDWDFQLLLASVGVCGTKISKPLFTYRKRTGYRREENVAAFNEGRDAILAKWDRYWKGEETLMGCSGCPGGGNGRIPKPPPIIVSNNPGNMAPREGYMVLEYMGQSIATVIYTGERGTKYRFGNNPHHKMKYVFDYDVPKMMGHSDGANPMFKVVDTKVVQVADQTTPALVAVGPPVMNQSTQSSVAVTDQPAPSEILPDLRLPESGPVVVNQPPPPALEGGTPVSEVVSHPTEGVTPESAWNEATATEGVSVNGIAIDDLSLPTPAVASTVTPGNTPAKMRPLARVASTPAFSFT